MSTPQSKTPPKPITCQDLVGSDNWRSRRRVLFLSLIFGGVLIAYLTILGKDTVINQQAVVALIAATTAMLSSYIFGAVWDDHNKRMFFKNMPGMPDLPSPPPSEGS